MEQPHLSFHNTALVTVLLRPESKILESPICVMALMVKKVSVNPSVIFSNIVTIYHHITA